MMIHFRKATIDDIPLIRELTFKVWPQTYAGILSGEQIDYMLDLMYSSDSLQKQMEELHHQFIIGFDAEEPVAFASFSAKPDSDNRIWRVHKIYILPGRQGLGIGRKSLDQIAADLMPLGATTLELNVNRHNPARSFYERIGFVIVGEQDIDIGNGYYMNDYVMKLELGKLHSGSLY